MYLVPLIQLLGVCGVPAMIAAGIVLIVWVGYAMTVRRK